MECGHGIQSSIQQRWEVTIGAWGSNERGSALDRLLEWKDGKMNQTTYQIWGMSLCDLCQTPYWREEAGINSQKSPPYFVNLVHGLSRVETSPFQNMYLPIHYICFFNSTVSFLPLGSIQWEAFNDTCYSNLTLESWDLTSFFLYRPIAMTFAKILICLIHRFICKISKSRASKASRSGSVGFITQWEISRVKFESKFYWKNKKQNKKNENKTNKK